jgi:hypothetical protein
LPSYLLVLLLLNALRAGASRLVPFKIGSWFCKALKAWFED